ncbi:MAG: histidine phosphatase family protein [Bacteroides sp.]|nr:histidine phosphatase family protein [Bacteroides sp.]
MTMVKASRLILLAAALLAAQPQECCAQGCPEALSPAREVLADKMLSTTNHRRYPEPTAAVAEAPEGYVPFHISTYARHGSRFLLKRDDYADALAPLCRAEQAGVLTPAGRRVKRSIEAVLAKADEGRYGELTAVGRSQHRGIARRMYARFPEVFADSAEVDARSTDVLRCVMSMMAQCLELQSLNPTLRITHDASRADMRYLNDIAGADSLHARYHAMRQAEKERRIGRLDPAGVLASLYDSPAWIRENITDPCRAYYNLFFVASNMQSHEDSGLDLMWLFTPEECRDLWQVNNVDWYLHSGSTPLTARRMPFQQQSLLAELIADGDRAAASRRHTASLRFGHESIVLPTVVLLGIDGFGYDSDDLDSISEHWGCHRAFPMAANLQMVFYENAADPGADVLVRLLLNEQDARLPLDAVSPSFYRWADFSAFYKEKLNLQ